MDDYLLENEEDLLDQTEPQAYSDIHDRPINQDPREIPGSPSVKSFISKKRGLFGGESQDPLMKQYESEQADLNDVRALQGQNNFVSNLGLAAAQIAQGSNRPEINTQLYRNIADQGQEMVRSHERDLERRRSIMNAIESRNLRQNLLQSQQAEKERGRDFRSNAVLGNVTKDIRNDPIIKPAEINLASLGKAQALLNNPNVPITSQVLADAEQDIASALSLRSQGATEGRIGRTELIDLNRKFAEARQKYGNSPVDLRQAAPELVEQVRRVNQALQDDYKTTLKDRKNQVLGDYESIYGEDPRFKQKTDRLRQRFEEQGASASPPSAFPRVVRKDGHKTTVENEKELKEALMDGWN